MTKIEKWAADIFSDMKRYGIRQEELAREAGYTRTYISAVFAGRYNAETAKPKIKSAMRTLIEKRKQGI